jgi:3'-5' exoribonuclease
VAEAETLKKMTETVKKQNVLGTGAVKKLPRDSKFYCLGVVSKLASKKDKNNKTYWELSLMDKEGTIEGKIWGNAEWWDCRPEGQNETGSHEAAESKKKIDPLTWECMSDLQGQTVGLLGQVAEFRGQPQYNFNAIYYVDQNKYPPYTFVQRSPFPLEEMKNEFFGLVESCQPPIKDFLAFVFSGDFWRQFENWPAAVSHHHAYVSGLLEHTLGVARLACGMVDASTSSGYGANRDLVVAGALLHDIGKIDSYRLSPAPEMTVEGTVIDHIVLGYNRFSRLAEDFGLDEKYAAALGHIIVSHHGCKEFGSPVVPATPEAMIVSAADELDFKLYCWRDAVDQIDEGKEISEWNYSAQRRFWKWELE